MTHSTSSTPICRGAYGFYNTLYVRGAKEHVMQFFNDGIIFHPTENQRKEMRSNFVRHHFELWLTKLSEEERKAFEDTQTNVWRVPQAEWAECSIFPELHTLSADTMMAEVYFTSHADEVDFEAFIHQLKALYPNLSLYLELGGTPYEGCGIVCAWENGFYSWYHPCYEDMVKEYHHSPIVAARQLIFGGCNR